MTETKKVNKVNKARLDNKRLPKDEYFFLRMVGAFEAGYMKKAAYYKARYENLKGSEVVCYIDENNKYFDLRQLNSHPNYLENKVG